MNALTQAKPSFGPLNRILIGGIQCKLMKTAIKAKIFNRLLTFRSAQSLADEMDFHPETTRIFLDGLAACGLVEKDGGQYRNSDMAAAFLVTSRPAYLGEMFASSADLYDNGMYGLAGLLRTGPPEKPAGTGAGFEAMAAKTTHTMARVQLAGFARLAADIVSELPEFPRLHRMLDLGGGPGLTGMAVMASHPDMRGVVFDFPSVIQQTEAYIREYGMADRVTTCGGDFRTDAIGTGFDLVWAAGTLNFAGSDLDGVVRKIHGALTPGGIFISLHEGLTREGTAPVPSVLSQFPMAVMGMDFSLNRGRIPSAMLGAGFRSTQSRSLETPMGMMELDIARKC